MDNSELRKDWAQRYAKVDDTLQRLKEVNAVATAFNTNVDAVLKISGKRLQELVADSQMSWEELNSIKETKLNVPQDVIKGLFKCFSRGIAEEWLTEDKRIYDWMVDNIGYERLQMGGQGGIVANALAAAGIKKVYAHANSLPELQSKQFLKKENLFSFDEKGKEQPAYLIDRKHDIPLIHWILEFSKGEKAVIDGHEVVCPKSNRFIATYDPLNLKLVMDEAFVEYTTHHPLDYVVLSGFHALTANNGGCELVNSVLPIMKEWKQQNPKCIIHLEIASTQDIAVRQAIVDKVAPEVDSIGLNERETIDVLEIIGEQKLAAKCEQECTSVQMAEALLRIKKKLGTPRIQVHMYGLYITLQDKGFVISPEANLRGMCLAATAAAGKASLGKVEELADFVVKKELPVTDDALENIKNVAKYIGKEELAITGISEFAGYDIIAVPTLLVDKPVTLVGMGDTISSISLVASR